MSGIASVVLMIIGLVRDWQNLPSRALLIAGIACFFIAAAKVWTTEHKARLAKEIELEKLTKPDFEITVWGMRISLLKRSAARQSTVFVEHTAVSFWAKVLNRGAPSVLKGWKFTATPPGGTSIDGGAFRYQQTMTLDGPDGLPVDILATDYLVVKGTASPIPTGGQADGFNVFLFPPNMQDTLAIDGTKFVLQLEDVSGKFYYHNTVWKGMPMKAQSR